MDRSERSDARVPAQDFGPKGGIRAGLNASVVEGPGLYLMGIVDVLQTYSLGKQLERFAKTMLLCQPAAGVSVAPPPMYAERFRVRVINQLISDYRTLKDHHHHHHKDRSDADDGPRRRPTRSVRSEPA